MNIQNEFLINIEDLYYHYPAGEEALRGINLKIRHGECIALIGQNGAGKSTLAKHFNGLLYPSRGKVISNGLDTSKYPIAELAKHVGYVFQNPDHQIFHETLEEEIAFGLKNINMPKSELDAKVDAALDAVDLLSYKRSHPYTLSRGQKQRLAFASVLAMECSLIVLDEPTTGQDYLESHQIMELVMQLNSKGHAIVFITHDMELVAEYAKRAVVLGGGSLLLDTSVPEVFRFSEILAKTHLIPPTVPFLAHQLSALGNTNEITKVEALAAKVADIIQERRFV